MSETFIIVLNGPSGAGKSSLMEHLCGHDSDLFRKLPSVTTRPRRFGEDDERFPTGQEYSFVSREEFKRLAKIGRIVKSGELRGHLYGLDLDTMRLLSGSRHGLIALTKDGIYTLSQVPDLAPRVRLVSVIADPWTAAENLRRRGDNADLEVEKALIAHHEYPKRPHATVRNDGRTGTIYEMAKSLKSQLGIERKA